jgi:hypothetical protein
VTWVLVLGPLFILGVGYYLGKQSLKDDLKDAEFRCKLANETIASLNNQISTIHKLSNLSDSELINGILNNVSDKSNEGTGI